MDIEEEATKILTRLGLTNSQSKVYLTLLKLENATAKTIANNSKVARQEVYRVLVELEEKSLVERIIAVPTKFRAISIENGLAFLVGEKRKELSELQRELNKILPKIRSQLMPKEDKQRVAQEEANEFILIPDSKPFLLRMERALEAAKKSVEVICPKEAFLRALFNLSEKFKEVLKRGVKIRCLVNEPLDRNSWAASVRIVAENPNFEIRVLSVSPKENFWIYDKREAFLFISSLQNQKQSSVLWTTAEPLISISEKYFNTLWEKCQKPKAKE